MIRIRTASQDKFKAETYSQLATMCEVIVNEDTGTYYKLADDYAIIRFNTCNTIGKDTTMEQEHSEMDTTTGEGDTDEGSVVDKVGDSTGMVAEEADDTRLPQLLESRTDGNEVNGETSGTLYPREIGGGDSQGDGSAGTKDGLPIRFINVEVY